MKHLFIKYLVRFSLLAILLYSKSLIGIYRPELGKFYFFISSVLGFFLLFTTVNIVTAILVMMYRLRKNIPYKYTDNVINGINNVYYLIVTFGVVLMILGFWGIDFRDLITSLSIVAAALAVISKDYVGNIMSGIIISFSKEINIDDYVRIGDNKGKILDINLNKVTLLNDDDDIIYLPNEKVFMAEIINYTKKEIKKVSIDFELGMAYHTTIEKLEKHLSGSLSEFQQFIEPGTVSLKIVDVHHDYLSLKFQFTLKEVNREVERNIRKKTIRMIANSVKEAI
ncbi:MAG: mechanosensitive ion channel family protein [Saprospiraceae bacterium]|jgi:small-conductance mechanosensitive channel|nr:mechanosensitive ion channel family protein [Saprospiraceae bacterium]